jgi:hypothetical protein
MTRWTLTERMTLYNLFVTHGFDPTSKVWIPIFHDINGSFRDHTNVSEDFRYRNGTGTSTRKRSNMWADRIEKPVGNYTAEELRVYNQTNVDIAAAATRFGIAIPLNALPTAPVATNAVPATSALAAASSNVVPVASVTPSLFATPLTSNAVTASGSNASNAQPVQRVTSKKRKAAVHVSASQPSSPAQVPGNEPQSDSARGSKRRQFVAPNKELEDEDSAAESEAEDDETGEEDDAEQTQKDPEDRDGIPDGQAIIVTRHEVESGVEEKAAQMDNQPGYDSAPKNGNSPPVPEVEALAAGGFDEFIALMHASPELLMVHNRKVELSNGKPTIVVRAVDSVVINLKELFVQPSSPTSSIAGRVHRVNFTDQVTETSAEVDVLECSPRLCVVCNVNATPPTQPRPERSTQNLLPIVHEDDVTETLPPGPTFLPTGRFLTIDDIRAGRNYSRHVFFSGGRRVLAHVVARR